MKAFIESAEVTESRKKSEHIDQIILRAVQGDDFLLRHSRMLCDVCQIRTILSAITNRNLEDFLLFISCLRLHFQKFSHSLCDLAVRDYTRIVVDQQRAECRNHIENTLNVLFSHQLNRRLDSLVDLWADLISKLNQQGTVTCCQNTDFTHAKNLLLSFKKVF